MSSLLEGGNKVVSTRSSEQGRSTPRGPQAAVSERAERCRLGTGRRATAKAIRVVVLARVKVDEGSGLMTRKDEEKGGLKRLLFHEPARGRFYTQAS